MTLPVERDMPAGSYDLRREQLIMTINNARPARRRRLTLVSAITAATLLGGTGAAVAFGDGGAIFRNSNGVTVVNTQDLKVIYNGATITQDDLNALQQQHKAMFTATDGAAATQGVMHAFDTQSELDAYSATVVAAAKAEVAKHTSRK